MILASSNPVDMGWSAVRNRLLSEVGNSWLGIGSLGWETTVKDYGVSMVRPQGSSRVPIPSTESQ